MGYGDLGVMGSDLLRTPHLDALAQSEGILAALESSHAVHAEMDIAGTLSGDKIVLLCLSGRGDKDAAEIARLRSI